MLLLLHGLGKVGFFLFQVKLRQLANVMINLQNQNPKNIYGWGGKFWTCCILGKVPEFIESAEKVTDINPENKYAWSIKGQTYFILGKVKKSLECYEKYIELDKLDKKEYNVVRSSDYEWITKGSFFISQKSLIRLLNVLIKRWR